MNYMLYKEAFIEFDQWRWRFKSSDEGLFSIRYEEYEEGKWIDKGPADDLHTAAKDQIIAAINTVCETAG